MSAVSAGRLATPTTGRAPIAPAGDPGTPAIVTATETVTHGALRRMVADGAAELAGPRRLAMIRARRDLDTVVAYLAAMHAGHPVLLCPPGPGSDTGWEDTFPVGLVHDSGSGWESTGARCVEMHPELALLLGTSGTTGSPRLVRLSAANVASNAVAVAEYLGIRADDRALATLPLHYCYGLSVLNSHMVAGAAVVLTESGVADQCCWDLAESNGATSFAGVPHTFTMIERRGDDRLPASLRTVTQAGGRMAPEAVRRWAARGRADGFDFVVMYGQTEATARMAWLPPELAESRPEAIGVPVPGGSFRLDDGELVYEGPNVMMGYAHGCADLVRGPELRQLHTGDLARQAPDGLWEITGRRSRFAKPLGTRIELGSLENSLEGRGITAACVTTTAADAATELVGILVESGGAAGDGGVAAVRFASEATGLPAAAFRVATAAELPRNRSGKVDLAAAAVALATPAGTPSGSAGTTGPDQPGEQVDVASRIASVFAEAVPARRVGGDDSFVELGGDSLTYVEVSMHLEDVLGHLPANWHLLTVDELAALHGTGRSSRMARMEIGGVLRAAGILMVVGRHVQLTDLGGGAHVLMALSGFNFSRFPLTSAMRHGSAAGLYRAAARVAVPTALWLAAVVVLTGGYSWANVGFLNAVLGPDSWGDTWRYWYLEALVQILLLMALLLSFPAFRRRAARAPFAVPLALTALSLTIRFGLVEYGHEHRQVNLATGVLWLFLVGWSAHRAGSTPRKLLVSAIALAALPGWFGDPTRELIVAGALLAIIWVREVPVPRLLAPAVALVGGASMWIYLTHWQVYPPAEGTVAPFVLLVASVLTGVLAQKGWDQLVGAAAGLWRRYGPSTRRRTRSEPVAETSSNRPLSSAGR